MIEGLVSGCETRLVLLFAVAVVAAVPCYGSFGPVSGRFGFWFRSHLLHFLETFLDLLELFMELRKHSGRRASSM